MNLHAAKLCVLIPVRPLDEGKQRLAPVLGTAERYALNLRFFRHVLDVACEVVPAGDCIVVSRCPVVRAIAHVAGAQVRLEAAPGGLNAALEQAAGAARERGARTVLSLACDLPRLHADDLRALIARAAPGRVVLGADRHGTGTNALLMAPGAVPYRYGPGSRDAHHAAARAAGLAFETMLRPGIAGDVDVPEDLDALVPDLALRRVWPHTPAACPVNADTPH